MLTTLRIESDRPRLRGERAIHYTKCPQNKKCKKVDSAANWTRAGPPAYEANALSTKPH